MRAIQLRKLPPKQGMTDQQAQVTRRFQPGCSRKDGFHLAVRERQPGLECRDVYPVVDGAGVRGQGLRAWHTLSFRGGKRDML